MLDAWQAEAQNSGSLELRTPSDNYDRMFHSNSFRALEGADCVTTGLQVEMILRSSPPDGLAVLNYYIQNNCLNNRMRRILSNAIINHELRVDANRVITTKEFIKMAKAIEERFPTERAETYYTPYASDGKGKKQSAKGKLFDKYMNRRRSFRACGLITSKERVFHRNETVVEPNESIYSGNVGEQIRWLTRSNKPWSVVEQYWKSTCDKRLQHFYNDPDLSIDAYLKLYPALQESEGYKLINLDFASKYPDEDNAFFNSWDMFTEKILEASRTRCGKDVKWRQTIMEAGLDINAVDKTARNLTAFYLLSYILPKSTSTRNATGLVWKPTRDQMKNGLLLQVQSLDEMKTALQTRREILAHYNLPIVPLPIIIGSLDNITAAYVNYNNVTYLLPTPLAAIDFCFKMHQVFKLDYSPENIYAWLFIQRFVYRLIHPWTRNYVSINILASDLQVCERDTVINALN